MQYDTTRDNTRQHKATRVQYDTTRDNTSITRVQHDTTRENTSATRDNTSTTRGNKNTTRDKTSIKQHKIYFNLFISPLHTREPGILGSKALLML